MRKVTSLIFSLLIFFGFQTAFSQNDTQNGSPTNPVPDWVQRNAEKRAEADRLNGKDQKGMIVQPVSEIDPKKAREIAEKAAIVDREKLIFISDINKTFAPPKHYLTENADFIKQENAGIARMFPEANCGKGNLVTVEELERCAATPQIKGGGSLYSIKLTRIPKNLPLNLILSYIGDSDMYFAGNKLNVGGKTTLSAISEIGEIGIDDIDYQDKKLKFLRTFKPYRDQKKFEEQKKILEKGVTADGFRYSTSATVKLNQTYALRSITYQQAWQRFPTFWERDITALFKVIGVEKDGSIIMLWKILKEKDAPVIKKK